jgi:hypothetical protein
MTVANYVNEITVVDPDTGGDVTITIFKHENGGMFGIDSSFLDQVSDCICDPFCDLDEDLTDYIELFLNF